MQYVICDISYGISHIASHSLGDESDALKLIFAGAALIGAAMGVKQKGEDKSNNKD